MQRVLGVVAIAVVVTIGVPVEATARAGGPQHLEVAAARYDDEAMLATIASVLSTAQDTMAAIVDGFVVAAASAASQEEFDALQRATETQIHDIQTAAADALTAIRDETLSDVVWEAAQAAIAAVKASMNDELAVVNASEYTGPATTTTTTTTTTATTPTTTAAPTTTTTTRPAAATTTTTTTPARPTTTTTTVAVARPTTTTTTRPGETTTTTTRPGETTTTTQPSSTTSTTVAAAVPPPVDGGVQRPPPADTGTDDAMMEALFNGDAASEATPVPPADLSGWLASMLDVALPPMVGAVVLSPLILIEVIGRTVLRSGSSIIVPILLLGLALLFLRWRDRHRDAAPTSDGDDPQPLAASA